MKLNEIRPAKGAVKEKKRIGRGEGSGDGKTSGKGQKGQKSRSGYSKKRAFEGGQIPLVRRLPKRGFNNFNFQSKFETINIEQFENLELEVVTPEILLSRGMIKGKLPLKVLGNGKLTKTIEVHANSFSKSAETKINEVKGKIVKL